MPSLLVLAARLQPAALSWQPLPWVASWTHQVAITANGYGNGLRTMLSARLHGSGATRFKLLCSTAAAAVPYCCQAVTIYDNPKAHPFSSLA
jgi:hypothetical protein